MAPLKNTLVSIALLFALVRAQSLKLASKHQGASFFDGIIFGIARIDSFSLTRMQDGM
jgi:hypothetical protein